MRIAILTATEKKIGGVETFTHLLKDLLIDSGHSVEILTPDSYIPKKKTLGMRLFGLPYLNAKHYKRKIHEYDFVLANGEFGWGMQHPNMAVVFHGCFYGFAKHLAPFLNRRDLLRLKKESWIQKRGTSNKTVVTVSTFTKSLLEEQGIHVQHVIPNAVDTNRFIPNITPSSKYLCVANQYGKLGYYGKGIDILEELAKKGVEIDCVSNDSTAGKINWIPSIPQENIHTLYPKYKALIFPSRYEANAIVPLEAMACGIPAIMSPVGYANEIKKELPECVVDDWNPDSYFIRLKEIDNDYTSLSKRCRAFAEKHSLNQFKKNWLSFIDQMQIQ